MLLGIDLTKINQKIPDFMDAKFQLLIDAASKTLEFQDDSKESDALYLNFYGAILKLLDTLDSTTFNNALAFRF